MVRVAPTLALLALASASSAQTMLHDLSASNGTDGDRFGAAVALEGDRALVGAPRAEQAYVFDLQASPAVELAILTPPLPSQGFGDAVAIRSDVAFVASSEEAGDTGAVYVFEAAAGWASTAEVRAYDAAPGSSFGNSIDVNEAGDLLVVASEFDDFGGLVNPGSVYVFEREPAGWVFREKLVAPVPGSFERFGASVAISGETILVGASETELGGMVHVFERTPEGWVVDETLTGTGVGPYENFGVVVDLDEDHAVVGSRGAGVHFFERSGEDWIASTFANSLGGTPLSAVDSVAIEGKTALAGHWSHQVPFVEKTPCGWFTTSLAFADAPPLGITQFGTATDLDGGRALCGEPNFHAIDGAGPGHAYVFTTGEDGFDFVHHVEAPSIAVSGGSATFEVRTQSLCADSYYLVLGSMSGTSPGFLFGGLQLDLIPDAYMALTIAMANLDPFEDSFGQLDAEGWGTFTYDLGLGASSSLAGMTAHHAFLLFDFPGLELQLITESAPLSFH